MASLIVDVKLSKEDYALVCAFTGISPGTYPLKHIKSVNSTHPKLRLARAIIEHHIYETIRKTHPNKTIIDVGGAHNRHVLNKRENIHCLAPIISNQDVFKHEAFQASDDITSCSCTFETHLTDPCPKCDLRGEIVYMFIDTLYYLKPSDLQLAFGRQNCFGGYAALHKFYSARGDLLGEAKWWRVGSQHDEIMMTIQNEQNNSTYKHSACDWLLPGFLPMFKGYLTWRYLNNTSQVLQIQFGKSNIPTPTHETSFEDVMRAPDGALPFAIITEPKHNDEYNAYCFGIKAIGNHMIVDWRQNTSSVFGFHFKSESRSCIVEKAAVQFVSNQVLGLITDLNFKSALSSAKIYFKNKNLSPTSTEVFATAVTGTFLGFRENGKMLNAFLEGTAVSRSKYNNVLSTFIGERIGGYFSLFRTMAKIVAGALIIREALKPKHNLKTLALQIATFGLLSVSSVPSKLQDLSWLKKLADVPFVTREIKTNKIDGSEFQTISSECFSNQGPIDMRAGCGCTVPNTLKCAPDECRQTLQVYAPCFFDRCRLASACPHNAYRAFAKRQAQFRKPPDPEVLKKLLIFTQEFIEMLDIRASSVMTYDQWNANYPLAKRLANDKARKRLVENGLGPCDFPHDKSFVKGEIILKSPYHDVEYDPRLITGVFTEYNVVLGPIMATIREIMKSVFSLGEKPCEYATFRRIKNLVFTCGLNKEQRGKMLADMLAKMGNPIPYESDFSRYDGSLYKELLEGVEHKFYESIFTSVILPLLKVQLKSKGIIGNPYSEKELLHFFMDECRRTGDQNTTNGNSFINLVIQLFCIHMMLTQVNFTVFDLLLNDLLFLTFLGDDNLSLLDNLEMDMNKYLEVCNALGLNVKLKKPTLYNMSFCSDLFIPTSDGLIATQFPGRLLCKAFTTRNKFNPTQSKQWVFDQATNYERDLHHIPFMRSYFKCLREKNKPQLRVKLFDIDKANSTTEVQNLHCAIPHQTNDATYKWLQNRYNLSKQDVDRLDLYMQRDHTFESFLEPKDTESRWAINALILIVQMDIGVIEPDESKITGEDISTSKWNPSINGIIAVTQFPKTNYKPICVIPVDMQYQISCKTTLVKKAPQVAIRDGAANKRDSNKAAAKENNPATGQLASPVASLLQSANDKSLPRKWQKKQK